LIAGCDVRMATTLPGISVVTPCRNAARYVAHTIESVRGQRYPQLEHVLVDGASTDGTLSAIASHRDYFHAIISERDEGMYDAINKGFAQTTGEIMAWINADDIWLPGTLRTVGEIFAAHPQVEWISSALPAAIDENGAMVKVNRFQGFSRRGFLDGEFLAGAGWWSPGYIQQESTFWRRSLWERAGGHVDTRLKLAGDFELWTRFFRHAELFAVDVPLGCWRRHAAQQTSMVFEKYVTEANDVFRAEGGKPLPDAKARRRFSLRERCPERFRPRLAALGVIDERPWITYDWVSESWQVIRR